ncbi:MAG: ThiF family adenylyltransferase [Planctomycetota bacterium]
MSEPQAKSPRSPGTSSQPAELPAELLRYERQIRFAPLGLEGQKHLARRRVLIVGLGALGSTSAELLARAGAGSLRLVDRDWLEWSNLQRQSLYCEADVREQLPKAIAAARRLAKINSSIALEPLVADVTPANVRQLAEGVDLILDATDNFETRFLLNDLAWEQEIPWVYGGCLGAEGQTMTIIPGVSACLRCLMPDGPPAPADLPTCDTAGIIAPIIHVIAAVQVAEALKVLSGNLAAASQQLQCFSLWDGRHRQIDLSRLREAGSCPACHQGARDWLSGARSSQLAVLCGRNAVQLRPAESQQLELSTLADRLRAVGEISLTRFFLKAQLGSYRLTVFPDGRAIVEGTTEPAVAKRLYAQYVGV